jgi:hypothetical protein
MNSNGRVECGLAGTTTNLKSDEKMGRLRIDDAENKTDRSH